MSIFRKLQKDFPLYLGKFIVLLKENFSFAGCKPVHAYSDAEIDLTPNPRLYIGLSEDERLEKIKQNLAYVWADGYESKKWESRNIPYLGIRLTPSLVLHEMIGGGRGYDLAKAQKLAKKCQARFLTQNEYREVLYCWDAITKMRLIACDFPLEKALMWVYTGEDAEQDNDYKYHLCTQSGEVIWYSEWDDDGNVLLALR